MVVETEEEREARGLPVGFSTPYKAMGGLTGFSSLAEGYMRLDPSGRGNGNKSYSAWMFHFSEVITSFVFIHYSHLTVVNT
jgi:Protein FAM221A/B